MPGQKTLPPETAAMWRNLARQWGLLASPVRPCPEDVEVVEAMLAAETDLFGRSAERRMWVLGITPEIAAASCFSDFEVFAVERIQAMIDSVWPGNTGSRRAVRADWLQAPFPDQCFDLVIGDGCLTHVKFPEGVAGLLASVHRCLVPGGWLLLRQFCVPEIPETPDAVIAALRVGSIGSIHAFKWRLAMAVQGSSAADVALDAVWRAWNAAGIDAHSLAAERGWPVDEIATIDAYRGSATRYNFMPLDVALDHLAHAGFELVSIRRGSYELAERCPFLLLQKRRSGAGADRP